MALITKLNPIGVDVPIDKIQNDLYTALVTNGTWSNYESYHRAYKNETRDGIRPEVFRGRTGTAKNENSYKDVFMDDDFNVTSFFLVPDEIPVTDGSIHTPTISIIFQANLPKLYPNAPHRFDSEFHSDVINVLRTLPGDYRYIGIHTSIDDVYTGLDTSKVKWDDMQKFHIVRFEVQVEYSFVCNPTFASVVQCTINANVTTTDESSLGSNDGTAQSNITGNHGNVTYMWTTIDGSIPPGEEIKADMTGLSPGTYTVQATDAEDCIASDSGTVAEGTIVNPDDLPNLRGWIKADEESSFNGGGITDGTAISSVESITPATDDFDQGTPNRQPTWYEDGFGNNDLPRIFCDGNEAMSGLNSLTDPYSIMIVVSPTNTTGNRRFVCGSGAAGNLSSEGALMNDDAAIEINSDSGNITIVGAVSTQPVIFKAIFDGTSSKLGYNDSAYTTGDSGEVGMTNYGFGGYDTSTGFVLSSTLSSYAEIIVYSEAKTEEELDSLLTALNDKYDVY